MNRCDWTAAGLVLASLSFPCAPVRADDASIGSAHEDADGTLVLRLRAKTEDGLALGDGELRYAPGDPDYARIHRHLGVIPPGAAVPVHPFPKTWTEDPKTVVPIDRPPK